MDFIMGDGLSSNHLIATENILPTSYWRSKWNFSQSFNHENLPKLSFIELKEKENILMENCLCKNLQIDSPNIDNISEYLDDVIKFLTDNYVEDDDGIFTFSYKSEHISWLMLPNYDNLDLFIGFRDINTKQLIGFLGACPIQIAVHGIIKESALIDFVCIHKAYRGQRLCPLLYEIIDIRLQLKEIYPIVKTSGTPMPFPVADILYYHLNLNHDRCITSTFAPSISSSRQRTMERKLLTKHLSSFLPVESRHLESALDLFSRTARNSSLGFLFKDIHHIQHFLMERKDIIYTAVKEDPECPDNITDLFSLYLIPHLITLPGNPLDGQILRVGYISYHIATTIPVIELLKVAALYGRDYCQLDALNILPVGQITAEHCSSIYAGRGTGNLKYYCNVDVGISTPLQSTEIFLYPGV